MPGELRSVPPDLGTPSQLTQLSSLSVSLTQDLMRAALGPGDRRELLEVLAASVRHGQDLSARLLIHNQWQVLTVFPHRQLMHSTQPLDVWLELGPAFWQVGEVLPALVDAPAQPVDPDAAVAAPFAALPPLLWAVAVAGARGELLPELAGQAAYRVAPGVDLSGLFIPPRMLSCITRLRRETCSLREIADWPGVGKAKAMRLLNGLYLQSALIVSRTHPAATNEGWRGYPPIDPD